MTALVVRYASCPRSTSSQWWDGFERGQEDIRTWWLNNMTDTIYISYRSSLFYVINCGKAVCKPNYILNALTERAEQRDTSMYSPVKSAITLQSPLWESRHSQLGLIKARSMRLIKFRICVEIVLLWWKITNYFFQFSFEVEIEALLIQFCFYIWLT